MSKESNNHKIPVKFINKMFQALKSIKLTLLIIYKKDNPNKKLSAKEWHTPPMSIRIKLPISEFKLSVIFHINNLKSA